MHGAGAVIVGKPAGISRAGEGVADFAFGECAVVEVWSEAPGGVVERVVTLTGGCVADTFGLAAQGGEGVAARVSHPPCAAAAYS